MVNMQSLKHYHQQRLFLFFLAFFLFSCPVYAQPSYQATVLKITDGDTVWVAINGHRVKLRLLGIDTPEKYPGRKLERDAERCGVPPSYMKHLGQEATQHAKTLLHRGERVTVVTYGHGYYGRTLAVIILPDGSSFNEDMVADGYSCVYKYHGHKSRELSQEEWDRLNQMLDEARTKHKGLWGENYKVMERLCE